MAREKFADCGNAVFGFREIIQAEFEEALARFVFAARVR